MLSTAEQLIKELDGPDFDLTAAKAMAQAALAAVTQGKLGYAIICGTKRFQMPMNEKMNWEKSSERLVALFDLTNWRRRRPA